MFICFVVNFNQFLCLRLHTPCISNVLVLIVVVIVAAAVVSIEHFPSYFFTTVEYVFMLSLWAILKEREKEADGECVCMHVCACACAQGRKKRLEAGRNLSV